jgi:hypothetical protein|tara:strand:- start:16388 stop:16630 length:243 start_codon:yes stop_codon:yes gene_type:complete
MKVTRRQLRKIVESTIIESAAIGPIAVDGVTPDQVQAVFTAIVDNGFKIVADEDYNALNSRIDDLTAQLESLGVMTGIAR